MDDYPSKYGRTQILRMFADCCLLYFEMRN
jgi:hypothetical protein